MHCVWSSAPSTKHWMRWKGRKSCASSATELWVLCIGKDAKSERRDGLEVIEWATSF
jgi:hypothetical protein